VPSRPGGPVFGHRAAFASFAPASQCLAAPEPLEALNPKTEKFLIATSFLYFELPRFEITVVVVPYEQVATCPILVCTYNTILVTITLQKLPLLFLGEGWGEVNQPSLKPANSK
jgi:hypothetical protein